MTTQGESMQMQGGQGGWGPPPGGAPPGGQGGWGQPPGAPPGAPPGGQGGWGQPPGAPPGGQGGWGQPPGAPPGGQGGWGQAPFPAAPQGGATTFEAIIENFKLLMARGGSTLWKVYGILALAAAALALPQAILQAMAYASVRTGNLGSAIGGVGFGFGSLCAGLFALAGNYCVATLFIGVTRTQRALLLEGPHAIEGGVSAVLKRASQNFGSLLLYVFVCGLAIAVGVIGCGIGLLVTAFLFGMAPYLLANVTTDIGGALKRSYELAIRNIGPLAICIGISIVVGFLFGMLTGLGRLVGNLMGVYGAIVATFVGTVLSFAFNMVVGQFATAAHISVEAADTHTPIVK